MTCQNNNKKQIVFLSDLHAANVLIYKCMFRGREYATEYVSPGCFHFPLGLVDPGSAVMNES